MGGGGGAESNDCKRKEEANSRLSLVDFTMGSLRNRGGGGGERKKQSLLTGSYRHRSLGEGARLALTLGESRERPREKADFNHDHHGDLR